VTPAAPERWLLLQAPPPPRGDELLLVDALRRLGARLVEREGDRFAAYFPDPGDPERLLRRAAAAIRASTRLADPALSWRWADSGALDERWRREARARRVGERIVVAPAGAAPLGDARPGDLTVRLTPGHGFGTADHPTTRICLRLLESAVRPGDRVADVGAGSAILSIAAVLLGADRAVGWEADRVACATARENARASGVEARVELHARPLRPGAIARHGPFRGIVANLEWHLLAPLLPGFAAALDPGGWAILSGAPLAERDGIVQAARAAGFEPREELHEHGWWGARFICGPDSPA
jgi:ribosomal protein L11 methyltransferase